MKDNEDPTLLERVDAAEESSSIKRVGLLAAAVLGLLFAVATVYLRVIHLQ